MHFDIVKIVLWPKDSTKAVRVVKFEAGRLNIICGVSRTGKSAIVPLIDYCLGADKCAIPTGIIREKTAWFGVIIRTIEGEKLFARREPDVQQATDDMHVMEVTGSIDVPSSIQKNANRDIAKQRLDQLAGLTKLDFSIGESEITLGRPSFRDLGAFTFQPQNIVANPNVLFYKADTIDHRQKLRAIFPYVLGAITAETLAKQHQLYLLQRELRRKELELERIASVSERWQATARSRFSEAKELGLVRPGLPEPQDYRSAVGLLQELALSPKPIVNPTGESLREGVDELNKLNEEEDHLSQELSKLRRRFAEMEELRSNTSSFRTAIQVQHDRLQVSRWLRDKVAESHECPVCGSGMEEANLRLATLVTGLKELEDAASRIDTMPPSFDRELERVRAILSQYTEKLAGVRIRRESLEAESEQARNRQYSVLAASRFLGRLESDLKTLESIGEDGELRSEVEALREQVRLLELQVSAAEVGSRLRRAVQAVELFAGRIMPLLDAERPNDPLQLLIQELTIRVTSPERHDYLWEIGSGSNWLSYHVALTLALQRYFLTLADNPVPAYLIYDQPSQVYFPKRLADRSDEVADEVALKDQDVEAVRHILNGMASVIAETKGALQIIVLDHAPEEVWGTVPLVFQVEDWREGRALIPADW